MQPEYSNWCKSKAKAKLQLKRQVRKLNNKHAAIKRKVRKLNKKLIIIKKRIAKHKKAGNTKKLRILRLRKLRIYKKIQKHKGTAKQLKSLVKKATKVVKGKVLTKPLKATSQKKTVRTQHKKLRITKKKVRKVRKMKRVVARKIRRVRKLIAKNKSKKQTKSLKRKLKKLVKKHTALKAKLNKHTLKLKTIKAKVNAVAPNVCSWSSWTESKGFLFDYGSKPCRGVCVAQTQQLCGKKSVNMACAKYDSCDALWAFWNSQQKAKKIEADVRVCCNVKVAASNNETDLTKNLEKLSEECRTFKKL